MQLRIERRMVPHIPWGLIFSVLAVSGLGIFNLASASRAQASPVWTSQAIYLGVSLLVGLVVCLVDYRVIQRMALPIYVLNILALLALRIIDTPVSWLATDHAVYIGIVYSYFPFMVLPLYAALERMDETLLEAAADLGAPPWRTFMTVTVPLSLPGIVAGCLLCFIPITGEFVIPDLLGSSATTMIGQVLWLEFFGNRDWPVASALAVMLLVILVTPIMIYRQREARQMEKA